MPENFIIAEHFILNYNIKFFSPHLSYCYSIMTLIFQNKKVDYLSGLVWEIRDMLYNVWISQLSVMITKYLRNRSRVEHGFSYMRPSVKSQTQKMGEGVLGSWLWLSIFMVGQPCCLGPVVRNLPVSLCLDPHPWLCCPDMIQKFPLFLSMLSKVVSKPCWLLSAWNVASVVGWLKKWICNFACGWGTRKQRMKEGIGTQ